MSKVIICGGRDYKGSFTDLARLSYILCEYHVSEVVSGTCKGADLFGEKVAKSLKLSISKFPADWEAHGKSAGFIRNKEMLDFLSHSAEDFVFALPGGRGTQNMIDIAKKAGFPVLTLKDY